MVTRKRLPLHPGQVAGFGLKLHSTTILLCCLSQQWGGAAFLRARGLSRCEI